MTKEDRQELRNRIRAYRYASLKELEAQLAALFDYLMERQPKDTAEVVELRRINASQREALVSLIKEQL